MKASELRVGNFVKPIFQIHEHIVVGQINYSSIDTMIRIDDNNSIPGDNYPLDHIEPIAISEEWILNLGLEKNSAFGFGKGSFWLILTPFDYFEFRHENEIKQIRYVHHLQNLYYCFTGEELTIKDNAPQPI